MSLAEKPSTAWSQEHDVSTKWTVIVGGFWGELRAKTISSSRVLVRCRTVDAGTCAQPRQPRVPTLQDGIPPDSFASINPLAFFENCHPGRDAPA
ncbi:hypothetical protein MES5069_220218 [Mesorhizobium escarrei]|uniref:Uncharacterized protein n=1 Tax=Mesorhizobium escarrei TaxID=666018 RepID=A0ABM9DS58_9HYPH|nr:hypothetical protein MES5069_220218 [Mesorhizobium escarrei]